MERQQPFRLMVIGILLLAALSAGCAGRRAAPEQGGLLILHWIERPNPHGPSTTAAPADRVRFEKFLSYDPQQKRNFSAIIANLREGDVIAYRMRRNEARVKVVTGHVNILGYDLLKYGHLAIVVNYPQRPNGPITPRLFSSESFIGPNTHEGIDTLKDHEWDAYRLDQWDRVDLARFHEFIGLVEKKAGRWYGYDFSGMFGLWNSNLRPNSPDNIGHDYICSTIVLAALYYSGVQLDAVRNNGYLDICTPLQVVSSPGRIITPPRVRLTTAGAPTPGTIAVTRVNAKK